MEVIKIIQEAIAERYNDILDRTQNLRNSGVSDFKRTLSQSEKKCKNSLKFPLTFSILFWLQCRN